uniref:Trafficking protein particle complex subunit 2-like protein n=2 Tax=Echinococcus granulosus TaxID=6210 RepID=A0A068X1E3_ECHGR|nr:Sedlin [Echinococcus granulosus]
MLPAGFVGPCFGRMCECVAVISSKNSPLFFKTSNPDEFLSNQFRVYGSLDIVEEKLARLSSRSSYGDKEMTNNYLGMLYPIDDHYVYGYVTNTNIKFILVQEAHSTVNDLLKSNTAAQVDSQVKKTFETLHDAYVDLVSSPFYIPNTPIDPSTSAATKKFERVVDEILKRSANTMISKL